MPVAQHQLKMRQKGICRTLILMDFLKCSNTLTEKYKFSSLAYNSYEYSVYLFYLFALHAKLTKKYCISKNGRDVEAIAFVSLLRGSIFMYFLLCLIIWCLYACDRRLFIRVYEEFARKNSHKINFLHLFRIENYCYYYFELYTNCLRGTGVIYILVETHFNLNDT